MSRSEAKVLRFGVPADAEPAVEVIGSAPAVQRAIELARLFAPESTLHIMLIGETGTGKELLARRIHAWSGRHRFVGVNCGALPADLVEGELFGHRRGAFTGAIADHAGLISAADEGTFLLDEVESLPPVAQVKLLRVLEEREVRRLGDTASLRVDVRFIAAAQTDLWDRVNNGSFRNDLLHRLAGVVIELPPLRSRGDDVLLLAGRFASRSGRTLGAGAEQALRAHHWPGNVRELRLAVERAVVLSHAGPLDAEVLAEAIHLGAESLAKGGRANGCLERAKLLELCSRRGWTAGAIAAAAGMSRATLFRRLKEFGISLKDLPVMPESQSLSQS